MMNPIKESHENAMACEQIKRDQMTSEEMSLQIQRDQFELLAMELADQAAKDLRLAQNHMNNVFRLLSPWLPPKIEDDKLPF